MKKWLDRYADGGPNLEDMKANFLQQYRPSPQADNTRLGSQKANVTNDQAQQLQKDAIRNAQRAAEERARLANARQTINNKALPFTFPNGKSKTWDKMTQDEKDFVQGQSLRTKGRIWESGKEGIIDTYLNPLSMLGNMAANAAESNYMAKETGSAMPYVMGYGLPLLMGRAMGSGSLNPFGKKFYTNSISDADFINNLGLGIPKAGINLASKLPLENVPVINQAYKINPWNFTGQEGMMYRGLGKEGVKDALESGVFRAKQDVEPVMDNVYGRFNMSKQFSKAYYTPKFKTADTYGQGYIAEVPRDASTWGQRYKKSDWSQIAARDIPVDEGRILKKNWLKGYVPVNVDAESSVLPILNANATSSNFENTKLGKALIGTNNLSTEFLGELLNGRKNRKGIKEGNEWLQNWIDHPATQAKIKNDMEEAVYKDFVTNIPANRQEAFLNLIENQSRNYKVNTKEYSLLQQVKDNIAQYRDINAREPIHLDNSGVSYEHAESPFYRDYVEKGGKPNKRYGNWVSRAHFSNKANTTVHEGTHGWTSRNALEDSGLRDMSLENTNPEIKNDFYEWEKLRNEGKSLKEIEKIMGKDRAFQAYIADPTEMHARTMELRKHFGIKPDEKFDVNDATKKLNKLSSLLKGNFKQPITGLKEYMNVIDNDPQKFANLLNNFWGLVPAGITIGALNNNSEPTNQYEYGGSIHNWREVEVPHKKNQLSGWLDKL